MHAVLLQGEGLTIERPQRLQGTLVGGAAALGALALAASLLLKASGWPISFPQFLAYVSAGLLVLLALTFGVWTYGCLSLRYVLSRRGLVIACGPIKHFIPMKCVEGLVHGRGEDNPRMRGLAWWGLRIGRGEVAGLGEVLFYSTHRSPEELVYIRTPAAVYAISPQAPARFAAELQRFQRSAHSEGTPSVQRAWVAAHPLWADRTAQALVAVGLALNLALWGYIFTVYPGLSPQITLEFPPLGDITSLEPRQELFKIPATALALLAVNLGVGLAFQWRERAAAYLVLSASVFFQLLFWVAAGIAVVNA